VTDRWGAQVTTSKRIKVGRTDVPPKTVISHLSYYGKPWGIQLNSFTVESPAKTLITVTCKGRGCPRGAFRKRTHKKRATLSFPAIPGNLRAGAKINVLYATPGRITGWDTITVRGNTQRVVIKNGCKFTGKQKRWKRCPS
jgi:hypothetical protein